MTNRYLMLYATSVESALIRVNDFELKVVQVITGGDRGYWAIVEVPDRRRAALLDYAKAQRPQWTIKECLP